MAFEIRVPRSVNLGRLGPSAIRALRSAPVRLQVRPGEERRPAAPVPDEDVELAVRERLYGARTSSR